MGGFFSHLEASTSEFPDAMLFLFWLTSFMETLAPSARAAIVWGPRPPIIFLQGLRARCGLEHLFQYWIFQTLREGAKHRINFAFVSQSWSKSKLSEITS